MKELIAREFCDETIALKQTLESGFIVLGERLSRIKREQMWEGQWSSFAEFLHEMDINEATASRLMTVYETYVEQYNIEQQYLSGKSWYTLYEMRKLIPENADTEKVKELVQSTDGMTRVGLKELIRNQEHPECEHEWYEVRIRQCRNCQKREALS